MARGELMKPSDWTKHFCPWFAVPIMWPVLVIALAWSWLHLQEACRREEDVHVERAHLIARCMRLEAEWNLLLKRNRQILGIERPLPP
jgi:hypothetical protein